MPGKKLKNSRIREIMQMRKDYAQTIKNVFLESLGMWAEWKKSWFQKPFWMGIKQQQHKSGLKSCKQNNIIA